MQTLSLRERRRKALLDQIAKLTRKRNEALKTLVRAENVLPKLERRARAYDRAPPARTEPVNNLHESQVPELSKHFPLNKEAQRQVDDGLDIPTYLDRNRKLQAMADPKTKEKKAERRIVEKQKREAKLTGKTRRMPLTGKAALDALK
jgi:hypothetical protein